MLTSGSPLVAILVGALRLLAFMAVPIQDSVTGRPVCAGGGLLVLEAFWNLGSVRVFPARFFGRPAGGSRS